MKSPPPLPRQAGFTMVELLLALALGVLVAGILGALIHGLLSASDGQSNRLHGPFAARAAVRALSRELTCAFAPPDKEIIPLQLTHSTEPGKPSVRLAFYATVPSPIGAGIEQVTFEAEATGKNQSELRRISVPCTGPYTNAPVTNRLFSGRFTLTIEAIHEGNAQAEWPPDLTETPSLPTSMWISLTLPGQDPIETEVLIQSALGIPSPIERETAQPEEIE